MAISKHDIDAVVAFARTAIQRRYKTTNPTTVKEISEIVERAAQLYGGWDYPADRESVESSAVIALLHEYKIVK